MHSETEPRHLRLLPVLLLVSLAAHAVLFGLPLPQSHPSASIAPTVIRLEPYRPPAQPDSPSSSADDDDRMEATDAALEAPADTPPTAAALPPRIATPKPSSERPVTESSRRLQNQIMVSARNLGSSAEPQTAAAIDSAPPRLPSATGWLHQHVGPVSPSIDRWKGRDGSTHSRMVLASGQVLCTRTRAPTIREFFHPWMSIAVPMTGKCGRERPAPMQRDNPWLRHPGKDDYGD